MLISEEIRWAAKYPFDNRAKKLLELIALDIKEYNEKDLEFLLEKAYKRSYNALNNSFSLRWENDYQEAILFYLSVLIIRGVKNEYIYRVFSTSESKRAYKLLRDDSTENVVVISKNLGMNIKKENEIGKIMMYFIDFVKISRDLSAIHWKLYNFEIEQGYVSLKKRQLARLCSEKVKRIIYKMIKEIPEIPEFIRNYSDKLKEERQDLFNKFEETYYSNVEEESFPPCIKKIISNISIGLSHPARFTLVTFLHRIGYSIEDIVNLFRKAPDFNEKMTRYQVEHILGMKGSRIEYSVPSCKKIKSYGLCVPDEKCRYIRHPLQYIKKNRDKKR